MTKQQLIEDNMKLVTYIIQKYYPTFLSDEDIFQCGMVGLCKAANTFDESKSTFSTYASKCIINEIRIEFCKRAKHQDVFSLDYEYSNGTNDNVTLKDMIVGQDDVDCRPSVIYQRLNPIERKILDYKIKGMTATEIAPLIGCSKQNVSKKIRKIKSKIKRS